MHTFANLILLIAIAICSKTFADEALPDGVYPVVKTGGTAEIERTFGGKLQLGDRLGDDLGKASIRSMSNDNETYRLWLREVPSGAPSGRAAVVCNGVCEIANINSDPDDGGKMELIVDIKGSDNAARVAEKLGIELERREHPGHVLMTSWRQVKETNKIGDPVLLEMKIKNVGKVPVMFVVGGQQRGPRDNQFRFIARSTFGNGEAVPDTGSFFSFGGLAGYRTLEPGDVFTTQVDITNWFNFDKTDTYQITGIYEIDLYREDQPYPYWNDLAVGQCQVKIVAGE